MIIILSDEILETVSVKSGKKDAHEHHLTWTSLNFVLEVPMNTIRDKRNEKYTLKEEGKFSLVKDIIITWSYNRFNWKIT